MRFPTMFECATSKSQISSMEVKLLIVHYLGFLKVKGGCTGSSESILVKIPHSLKSNVAAQMYT